MSALQRELTKKHTPPPLCFPESDVLSCRKMVNPAGVMAESGIAGVSQVSVNAITQQFLMSLWKLMRACSSSILLSIDCMLASRILGSGGLRHLARDLTRVPARFPLFFFLPGRSGRHSDGDEPELQHVWRLFEKKSGPSDERMSKRTCRSY